MAEYYSCNLDGQCEIDVENGQYNTLEECQHCQPLGGGNDAKEAAYIAMSYNLEQALDAAPSDRVQLIRRITGITVPTGYSWEVLLTLVNQDYQTLYHYPFGFGSGLGLQSDQHTDTFHSYLRTFLDDFDFLMLELSMSPLDEQLDW